MLNHLPSRKYLVWPLTVLSLLLLAAPASAAALDNDPQIKASIGKALDYLAREQRRQGYWEANGGQYRVAMTALAGMALASEGSTPSRGRFAPQIKAGVEYLLDTARPNGLIGYKDDYHYMYGHGFSMLFLSQIFGEEEDAERRDRIRDVLTKAVQFCGEAQTTKGGWGYVSAKDGNDFDEGSTCITQVQGLRGCRNAGIPVPKEIIDRAIDYIKECTLPDGGVQYSIRGGGARPAITAAAVACMFSSGEYESPYVKKLLGYCEKNVWPGVSRTQYYGHWHYTHYYFSQVIYRLDEKEWPKYKKDIATEILAKQSATGAWNEGHIGPVYTTAINVTLLQLDNGYLPIYQK